ncbi:hypothetical protein KY284_024236 [Solanum tuberosum]|nr:hypothetical protein KY284_024236 [Solanum tuberosum]
MLDKVEENPYQLGVRDTMVDRRVSSSGPDLEEFSDSSCEDDKSSKVGRRGEAEDESTIVGKKY